MGKLVIDGNSIYEIDEECVRKKEIQKEKQQKQKTNNKKNGKRRFISF